LAFLFDGIQSIILQISYKVGIERYNSSGELKRGIQYCSYILDAGIIL
jgi:hypothetical protein